MTASRMTTSSSERYIRTSEKPQTRLCKQNDYIARAFDDCNFALIELVRRNIAVTRVLIEDGRPRISIIDCRSARSLEKTMVIQDGDNFRRITTIHNCLITWETKDDER
jgi:hypothetical protein